MGLRLGRRDGALEGFLVGFRGVGFDVGLLIGFKLGLPVGFVDDDKSTLNTNEILLPEVTILEILIPVFFMPSPYAYESLLG